MLAEATIFNFTIIDSSKFMNSDNIFMWVEFLRKHNIVQGLN